MAYLTLLALLSLLYVNQASPFSWDPSKIDVILKNEHLLHNYVRCFLDLKRCSPEELEMKSFLPKAVKTDCADCTENQRKGVIKIVQYMISEKPELLKLVVEKFGFVPAKLAEAYIKANKI